MSDNCADCGEWECVCMVAPIWDAMLRDAEEADR